MPHCGRDEMKNLRQVLDHVQHKNDGTNDILSFTSLYISRYDTRSKNSLPGVCSKNTIRRSKQDDVKYIQDGILWKSNQVEAATIN